MPESSTAFIGVGAIGEALLVGSLRSGHAARDVVLGVRRPAQGEELAARYGVGALAPAGATAGADTVVLGVKPQDMADVIDEISPALRPGAVVLSLAAGITTGYLESRLPPGTSVVRAAPNIAALVGRGMHVVTPGLHCHPDALTRARALLEESGRVLCMEESALDAVTALSASGPAYLLYIVEAMVDAGVLLGLPRATAADLVAHTLQGTSAMLIETGQHPTPLREGVTSPGGTAAAALRVLEELQVKAAITSAIEASYQRAQGLLDEAAR